MSGNCIKYKTITSQSHIGSAPYHPKFPVQCLKEIFEENSEPHLQPLLHGGHNQRGEARVPELDEPGPRPRGAAVHGAAQEVGGPEGDVGGGVALDDLVEPRVHPGAEFNRIKK